MMEHLEKREYYVLLFDFYELLLTEKQRQYFSDYYFKDLSLMEIANAYNISRNAVYDQLTKTYKYLINFEEKLKLYYRYQERNEIFEQYQDLGNTVLNEMIEKLKKVE